MKELDIKGTIVPNEDKWIYDWFGMDATCPKDVENALKEANGEEVIVKVNSGGGDVFAGNEMYYLLNTYKGEATIDIVGFAGSAASVAAMARKTRIVPTGMIMIHNVSGCSRGDYNAMDKSSNILRTANSAIANAYRIKTGMTESELLDLMNKETWLEAKEAKEKGFVDEIINDNSSNEGNSSPKNLYNACFANVLSKEVIEKIRNEIKNPNIKNDNDDSDSLIEKKKAQANARLRLLNMEGMKIYD